MSFIIIILCLLLLIVLISYFKVDAFLAFIVVSVLAGIGLGIPLGDLPATIDRGIGNILGSLTLIIVLGAMLGKLVAESGAAQKIADVMVATFGTKYIHWGLMITGFIVGIPLFYGIGFVLLVPLIFSIVNQYKLPAVFMGISMLAALSVTHGFLPPHPSPVALVALFEANMGMTLIYGLCIAVPTIVLAGPLFGRTLRGVKTGPLKLFEKKELETAFSQPGKTNSFLSATLPVFLLILATVIPLLFPAMGGQAAEAVGFLGAPSIVMLIALIVATYTLGIRQGRSIKQVMDVYVDAIKDIAPILLIIAGSGIFKQVMEDSGVSMELAAALQQLPVHPLILGWLIAAVIRICIGSATVAALTAAGVLMPLITQANVDPNLMVLSLGAGSLACSHVNDSGFWLFKEYFNLSMKDTFRSWTVMETIVSVAGLAGVMLLNLLITN
ncbi:gluconate:H+ symporter [Parabacteroides sp. PF5-6]|uniref:gluconate:H+ symporter n=1 Tax=Parabacteroides sp. PF5-6 TaxID=1742403 RepID=UPI0024060CE2|nr:gluconate:H+ symporter [Parabacteroides sp. PF5-6]MDF9828832.1 Gnt-I system high-affinity gluconate transporter [Parabacteroides sp. PF5-6]